MYKRMAGPYELKWNVKNELGKQAMSEVLHISQAEINEDNYILVTSEQARLIQQRYQKLTEIQDT